jgi:hypothetical protein
MRIGHPTEPMMPFGKALTGNRPVARFHPNPSECVTVHSCSRTAGDSAGFPWAPLAWIVVMVPGLLIRSPTLMSAFPLLYN